MYAAQGRCMISYVVGEEVCELTLREGEYIFLQSGVPHRLAVERESPCRVLNLELATIRADGLYSLEVLSREEMFRLFLDRSAPVIKGNDGAGSLHNAILSLQRLLQRSDAPLETDTQLALLLLKLARQTATRKKMSGDTVYVRRASAFIDDHFEEEITAADIAAAAGVSTAHLQRLFRAETGQTMTERIAALRVEKAKYLLETSILPVVEVAAGVGFNSRQHFSSVFTDMTGCSPAAYRKRKGNERNLVGHEQGFA